MFDSKYLTSGRQPTAKQLHKLRREGIHGGPNFLTWLREHVNPHLNSYLPITCIMFNHLTYLIGSQCVLADNVHVDLCQLSYRSVTSKSYGRYDVNGFRFCSTIFEASHPLAATTNTRVVTRVVDAQGHETKYYEIIKNIIEYNFAGNKNLKIVFFNSDWFDPNHGTQENHFGMVEVKHVHRLRCCDPFILAHQVKQVYYMLYPCEKLSAWWVVYKVNPHERLHTPDDSGYHENQATAGEVDEVYQDDELPCSFNIDLDSALNSLLDDANVVTVPEERKHALRKKRNTRY
jgi:hypothetical protein